MFRFKSLLILLSLTLALFVITSSRTHRAEALIASSANVALVPGPCGASTSAGCMPTSGFTGGYSPTFANVSISSLPNVIGNYDTVALLQVCNIGSYLADVAWRDALHTWISSGGKLIIYDSDACGATTLDYSNFILPFTTNNPGQFGSNQGTLEIVEDNTLGDGDPTSPYYIDVADVQQNTDAVGDASVMLTQDPAWKGHLRAENVLGAQGYTHTYAETGSGLTVYNGLDSDDIGWSTGLKKIWELELKQQWDPSDLPGGVPVAGCPDVSWRQFMNLDNTDEKGRWSSVDRYRDSCILPPTLVNTPSYPSPLDDSKLSVQAFDTQEPPFTDFLLWTAQLDSSRPLGSEIPVLLVHGVCGDVETTWDKMADALIASNRRTFAISFSYPCGSIEPKSQALADAVDIIQDRTGAERVDVVSHSMGGLVARYWMEGMLDDHGYEYRDQIRNLIMLGTPNGGFDFIFRHPQIAPLLAGLLSAFGGNPDAVPSPWQSDVTLSGGASLISSTSGKFDGILEMAFEQNHPLRLRKGESREMVESAYFGIPDSVTVSSGLTYTALEDGISTASALGGNFLERINAIAMPDSSNYMVLAGNFNKYQDPIFSTWRTLQDEPSDGIVFIDSVFSFRSPNLSCFSVRGNHTMISGMRSVVDRVVKYLNEHDTDPLPGGAYFRCTSEEPVGGGGGGGW